MANPKHLHILEQGVKAWNDWRSQNPDIEPDLRKVNLNGIDFSGEPFNRVNLEKTDLSGASLIGAELPLANLRWANLSKANLKKIDARSASIYGGDLQYADLSEANLMSTNLRKARLTNTRIKKADLRWADLSGADLVEATLGGSNLHSARLQDANLDGVIFAGFEAVDDGGEDLNFVPLSANLQNAKLDRASLKGVDFAGVNLWDASLIDANLHEAKLMYTFFLNTDLSGAKGLNACIHLGISIIDHQTLVRSTNLPVNFLQGCGLPDFIIQNIAILQSDAVGFHSCFISYSHHDEDFARLLHKSLQDNGVRCWFAPEDLKVGDKFRSSIYNAISERDKVILIFSEHSIDSHWVESEVETAFEKERKRKTTVLLPIRLDNR